MKGDLTVEKFPPDLKQAGKITALLRGETWRQFVIDAVAAHVAACAPPGGGGQAAENSTSDSAKR